MATPPQHPGLIEFISPLISCDQMLASHRQWRLHHKFMVACKCVGVCMTSDQIHAKFVPLMFKHITGKVGVSMGVAMGGAVGGAMRGVWDGRGCGRYNRSVELAGEWRVGGCEEGRVGW